MPPPEGFNPADYLTPREVSEAWKISPEAVRQLCRADRIPGAVLIADRPGPNARQRWYIPRSAIDSYPGQS